MTEIRYHLHLEDAASRLPQANPVTAPLAAAWPLYLQLVAIAQSLARIEQLLKTANELSIGGKNGDKAADHRRGRRPR